MVLFARIVRSLLGVVAVSLFGVAIVSLSLCAQAAALRIVTFPVNLGDPIDAIAVSQNGTVYAAASYGFGRIAVISPAGSVSAYTVPQRMFAAYVTFSNISIGPDGDAWFAGTAVNEFAGTSGMPPYPLSPWAFVDKIAPDGTITDLVDLPGGSFTAPPFTTAMSLVFGPRDRPWIMLTKTNAAEPTNARPFVTCLEPPATLCDYTSFVDGTFDDAARGVPVTPSFSPLVAGPDSAVWFVDLAFGDNYMMRVAADGSRSVFRVPSEYQLPVNQLEPHMTLGPDGALWFTEDGTRVGRMTLAGDYTFYALPVKSKSASNPALIVDGTDGNLWTTSGGCRLTRITPKGDVTLSLMLSSPDCDASMAAGNGTLWIGSDVITEVFLPASGT